MIHGKKNADISIAVVIPAYKKLYLSRALQSIAEQDDKGFSLYIGNDCSPEDIESVVKEFEDQLDIRYIRFDENLGGENLLAHWERCIDKSQEDYILFFSDDDILPYDAVSRAKDAIRKNPDKEFFRFGLNVIDGNDNILHRNPEFTSDYTDAGRMLCDKLGGKTSSAAIEYVFSRNLYKRIGGGFVHFPMAWCSDDATWFLMAKEGGVVNIHGNPVEWRNVTGNNISNSRRYNKEKMCATIEFLSWLRDNWEREIDSDLCSALKKYVKTILYVSLERDFTLDDSFKMFKCLKRFNYRLAFNIFAKMCNILVGNRFRNRTEL